MSVREFDELESHSAHAIARALPETAQDDLVSYVQSLVAAGDLSLLNDDEKTRVILRVCDRLGLDPISFPLIPLQVDGRETLYFTRHATDQLARIHNINRERIQPPTLIELGTERFFECCVRATMGGRTDEATGVVPFPEDGTVADIANARMHCETKAKRRAVLSILGLGFLDESELDTVRSAPSARRASVKRTAVTVGPSASAPADASPMVVENEPEAEEPATALDRLREDLDFLGDRLSLEQLVAIWRDHERAITSEAGGEVEAIERARDMVRARSFQEISRSAFSLAVRIDEQCDKVPALRSLRATLRATQEPETLAAAWSAAAPTLATLDPYSRQIADGVIAAQVHRIDPDAKHWKAWLRDALARASSTPAPTTVVESTAAPVTTEAPKPAPSTGIVLKITGRH